MSKEKKSPTIPSEQHVTLPPHFYGELCKTVKGCDLVKLNGHFDEIVNTIDDKNADKLTKRAALWTIGHVCSSDTGFEFAKGEILIRKIIHLAQNATCLSLRG